MFCIMIEARGTSVPHASAGIVPLLFLSFSFNRYFVRNLVEFNFNPDDSTVSFSFSGVINSRTPRRDASLTSCLRPWEYTEAIRNSIRSPWHDVGLCACVCTVTGHSGASHFLLRDRTW